MCLLIQSSENKLLDSVLSFHHEGPGNRTQMICLGSTHLHSPSQLSPFNFHFSFLVSVCAMLLIEMSLREGPALSLRVLSCWWWLARPACGSMGSNI